jgi:hypothetical protein
MPLTPAVASAPLVASRHVGKRISLCEVVLLEDLWPKLRDL